MIKDNVCGVTFRFKHVYLTLEIGSPLTFIATFSSFCDLILVTSGQFSWRKKKGRKASLLVHAVC